MFRECFPQILAVENHGDIFRWGIMAHQDPAWVHDAGGQFDASVPEGVITVHEDEVELSVLVGKFFPDGDVADVRWLQV